MLHKFQIRLDEEFYQFLHMKSKENFISINGTINKVLHETLKEEFSQYKKLNKKGENHA